MPANVETMAYRMESKADVPWHGLGTPISHDATPDEMLIASGLNWTVSKRPLFTPIWSEFNSIELSSSSLMSVDDYFSLVRDSDNKILGPAGKEYVPTQNRQAFDFFKKFTDAGKMRMETAGSLQGGKQVWVLAKLLMSFELPGGDVINGYLLMSSPHIWGKSLVIKFVTIRVVCNNTFTMAMSESKYGKGFRMPHIRAFDAEVASEAENSLLLATGMFKDFEKVARKLAATKVDEDVVIRYVADIFQKELITEQFGKSFYKLSDQQQAKLMVDPSSPKINPTQFKRVGYEVFNSVNKQPGADMKSSSHTLWGAFNAIIYYTDHLSGRDRDNALYTSWFGPKSVQKKAALVRASEIADAVSK